jgi:hypothetical protein
MEDTVEKQQDISKVPPQLQPHVYKKGQSGNPGGRPIGSVSMKTYVKNKLLSMSDEEREAFLEGVDKKILWEMAEGKAKQDVEVSGEMVSKVVRLDE